jgi:uncharacterized membrane protein HdeD (DUF308 family)
MSTSPLTTIHDVTRLWWLVALFGVIVAGVGIFFVVSPHETLSTFTVIAGIARGVAAFGESEGRGGNLAVAALDLVAGIVILAWPDLGLSTFAVILGIVLILRGILLIAAGWELRRVEHALPT